MRTNRSVPRLRLLTAPPTVVTVGQATLSSSTADQVNLPQPGVFFVRLVPRGLLRAFVPVLVGASIAVPTAAPASAAVASVAAVTKVTVVGNGYGHGRGMGQYGAYGYATMYRWTYQQILSRFYGGTTLGRPATTKETATVTVRLTALDGKDVRITSAATAAAGPPSFGSAP